MDAESHAADDDLMAAMRRKSALFRFAPNVVTPGGSELQRFLNRFPGLFLKEDGRLGPRTSAACKAIFGRYLQGDPRA